MRVCNIRDVIPDGHKAVYIGRANRGLPGSPLANPFKIGRDGDRKEVVRQYKRWLWGRICAGDRAVLEELARIHKLQADLVCWCAPLECHGTVIVNAIRYLESVGRF